MQQDILSRNADANLRVYAVWFNMLFGDHRVRWDGGHLDDPRVSHLWDEQKVVGDWFSANVTHRRGTTWDFYALYGPEATDLSTPLSMGSTIIGQHDQLAASITPLLGAPAAH